MALAPEPLRKMYELIGQDNTMLVEIISSFVEETPLFVGKLCDAVQSQNAEAAGMAAHALRSTSQDMGAVAFSSMCHDVEVICRGHSALPSSLQLNELTHESRKVVEALRQTLDAIKNGTWANGA
jgi:Hpt domain